MPAEPQPPAPVLSDEDKLLNAEIWAEIHGKRVKDLEALLTVCPVCENDFSGGGVDEPSADCSNCKNLGFVLPDSGALSDEEREALHRVLDAVDPDAAPAGRPDGGPGEPPRDPEGEKADIDLLRRIANQQEEAK